MKAAVPFTIIFEDEDIIVVNKASGISVGGDRWDKSKQRLDRLIADNMQSVQGAAPSSAGACRLFTVHRIDCETSGLVVFAKNEAAHRRLCLAFEERNVTKLYIAVVRGIPPWKDTLCDLPLIPNGNKQHMTIIDKYRGKKSLTRFTFLGSAGHYSVLEAVPETGRTHQIRIHAAALGFPIVCDPLYGKDTPVLLSSIKRNWRGDPFEEKPLLSRLGLHAMKLSFENHTFHAPLPRDMAALIKQMEKMFLM